MSELVEWLRDQIEAAAAMARVATPGPWAPKRPMLTDVVTSEFLGDVADCAVGTGYRQGSLDDAKHIARHDPVAVLNDCAAKLAILDEHKPDDRGRCSACLIDANGDWCLQLVPCRTVRMFGSAYKHRDGYREEWS